MALFRILPLKAWLAIGAVALVLALWGAYIWQKARADRAEARLAPAEASVVALDRVAVKTDQIRSESKKKEAEVDQIPGADQKLPDGFGRDLQSIRVRDRTKDRDSR